MRRALAVLLALAALAAAAPAIAGPAWSSSPVVDETTRWLAMRKVVHVRCQTVSESAADFTIAVFGATAYVEGWTDRWGNWHPGRYAVFSHGICETIDALAAGDASGYSLHDLAWAVLVLTHEAGHLRGHRWSADEARTECWAIRHVGYVAHRLGVVDSAARRLLVAAAVDIHENELDESYQLPGCELPPIR